MPKKLQLSAADDLRLSEAQRHVSSLLHRAKRRPLTGQALETMQTLERVAGDLDIVRVTSEIAAER